MPNKRRLAWSLRLCILMEPEKNCVLVVVKYSSQVLKVRYRPYTMPVNGAGMLGFRHQAIVVGHYASSPCAEIWQASMIVSLKRAAVMRTCVQTWPCAGSTMHVPHPPGRWR